MCFHHCHPHFVAALTFGAPFLPLLPLHVALSPALLLAFGIHDMTLLPPPPWQL